MEAATTTGQRNHGGGRLAFDAWLETALRNPILWSVLVAGIWLLQLSLIFTHEPWQDEWQALQIALQSPDFAALLDNLRYEGHPPLWYLLLIGVSIILPADWVLPAVQAAIATMLQALILIYSPFPRRQKLLLATSFFVLFDYSVLSRSLSLGALILTAFFAFRHYRASWLLIALLPLTDFLFGLLSIISVAIQWRARRLWWPGLLFWFVTGVAAILTVWPAPDVIPALHLLSPSAEVSALITRLSALLIPLHMANGHLQWNNPPPYPLSVVAGPLFLLFCWVQVRGRHFDAALLFGFATAAALFSIFVYPLAIRHLSLIAWLLILLRWHTMQEGLAPRRWFEPWLVALSICGLVTAGLNLTRPFDTDEQVARYIVSHGLRDAHWLVFPDSAAQGVSALIGMEFDRLEMDCSESFIRWNYATTIKSQQRFEEVLHAATKKYGRLYLLVNDPLPGLDDSRYVRGLAQFPPGYDGQAYRLYELGLDRPRTGLRAPSCPPRRVPLTVMARD